MQITHYLYNTFLLEAQGKRVAIDPGRNLYLFDFRSLIPESEWPAITHVVITHGDPDHHWQSDRVAEASQAHVVCGRGLTRTEGGRTLVVAPRGRGLTSWVPFDHLHALDVGDSIDLDGVVIEAVRAVHGPIAVPVLGFTLRAQPGAGERVGIGAMAFRITVGGTTVLNLGDTLLLPDWEELSADVLMLPIGGPGRGTWTMDVDDALQAVEMIGPRHVIPCHYNVPFLWKRRFAPADDQRFRREVERRGVACTILRYGETVTL